MKPNLPEDFTIEEGIAEAIDSEEQKALRVFYEDCEECEPGDEWYNKASEELDNRMNAIINMFQQT